MTRNKALLWCGPISAAWYVAINVAVPLRDPSYHWMSQTVSELSAIGAPTRELWVALGWLYTPLLFFFGLGLWRVGHRWPGGATILQAAINPLWPPMHLRPILATGGSTISDTLHLVFTAVWGLLSLIALGFGAVALGRRFRFYSIATILSLIVFGYLTGQDAPRMQANLPTPWIGVWERLNIGAYMLWLSIFALVILRRDEPSDRNKAGLP